MKEIKLTQGKVALVDDEDYEYLNQWKWYALKSRNTFYATRVVRVGCKSMRFYMHRVIMKEPTLLVDHCDSNGLHNYKSNLRECTRRQNGMNRKSNNNSTSIYKGVSYSIGIERWVAAIQINGKRKLLGKFLNEIDAALKYNEAAKEYFGEFALLNKIPKRKKKK